MMTELAQRYVQGPLMRGPLEGATHFGESDPRGDGPYMQIWLIIEEGSILKAAYRSPGCPSSSACGGVLCALVTGREVARALSLTVQDLLNVIGELPEGKGHYAERAIRALQAAADSPMAEES